MHKRNNKPRNRKEKSVYESMRKPTAPGTKIAGDFRQKKLSKISRKEVELTRE